MDYFTFGDFDSRNYSMYLRNSGEGRSRILSPPRVSVTDRPLGSSGEILFDQYYTTKTIPLDIFTTGEVDFNVIRQTGSYLSALGQQKLILSYEDYKYHLVSFDEQVQSIEYTTGMIFEQLNFKAYSPFGFSTFLTSDLSNELLYDTMLNYDSGLLYMEDMTPYVYSAIANNQTFQIYHGGNTNFAYPVFKFTGQATTLTLTQYTDATYTTAINTFSYGAFNGTLNVDGTLRNVFKNSVVDNTTFTGDFLSMNGVTTPSFITSGLLGTIATNTVKLSDLSSATNDYYNGMSIYILNNQNCIMERRTITDYVGSTKIATLDSAFTSVAVDDVYRIHNPSSGLNYLKITGSGFVNLGMTVDFRYVYL